MHALCMGNSVCVCSVYVCVWFFFFRERERERENMCVCLYVCVHLQDCMVPVYVYMCVCGANVCDTHSFFLSVWFMGWRGTCCLLAISYPMLSKKCT